MSTYADSKFGVSVDHHMISLGSSLTSDIIEDAMHARYIACEVLRAAGLHATVRIERFLDGKLVETMSEDEL
jgi:hypothetical protein